MSGAPVNVSPVRIGGGAALAADANSPNPEVAKATANAAKAPVHFIEDPPARDARTKSLAAAKSLDAAVVRPGADEPLRSPVGSTAFKRYQRRNSAWRTWDLARSSANVPSATNRPLEKADYLL
jgi:hypothetical protein